MYTVKEWEHRKLNEKRGKSESGGNQTVEVATGKLIRHLFHWESWIPNQFLTVFWFMFGLPNWEWRHIQQGRSNPVSASSPNDGISSCLKFLKTTFQIWNKRTIPISTTLHGKSLKIRPESSLLSTHYKFYSVTSFLLRQLSSTINLSFLSRIWSVLIVHYK